MKKQAWIAVAIMMVSMTVLPSVVLAQKINCKNEYRSGKLYFSQYRDAKRKESPQGSRLSMSEGTRTLLDKAIERYAIAVEHCPLDDAEFRWNNGIALGEAGLIALAEASVSPDEATKDEWFQKGIDYITTASAEFSAVPETKNGEKKKQLKMARENRLFYWTELYNGGLARAKEKDFLGAAKFLEAAIAMDPTDARSYRQAGIILFNAGMKEEAAAMVHAGLSLEIDPENQAMVTTFEENKPKLRELQLSLFSELGREAAKRAKDSESLEDVGKAMEYYDILVEAQADNPNHIYSRGLARMTGGDLTKDTDAAVSKQYYLDAAADMERAADMVPVDGDNGAFHLSAIKAAMYARRDAGDDEGALRLNLVFACLDPLNDAAWRGLARAYGAMDESEKGLGALFMSKSLNGIEVPLDIATGNATDDAKAHLGEMGNPSLVKSYQDGENSITTFIWEERKLARHYILGKIQQEVTWCQ